MSCFAEATQDGSALAESTSVRPAAFALDAIASAPDGAALRRLRWRARRGMLENDLILARFLDRHGEGLGNPERAALARLLELPDGELLELLLGNGEPAGLADDAALCALLARLRAA